jgi:hypothetical protein
MSEMTDPNEVGAVPPRKVKEPPRDYDEITYIPLEEGDKLHVTVGANPDKPGSGVHFTANVPTRVPRSATMMQLLVEKFEMKDGSIGSQGREKRVPIAKVLEGNPYFSINGAPPPRKPRIAERLPNDPNQYRSYAIGWIARAAGAHDLELRWKGEQGMRERCGVQDDDLSYISPFYEARLMELRGQSRHVAVA